jgi:hypothetical protein
MLSCKTIGTNGRLGNQMFQFAALYGIASSLGYKIHFTPGRLYEAFEMLGVTNEETCSPKYVYREPAFSFSQEIFTAPDDTEIYGYFQTQKYWKHVERDIVSIFTFKNSVKESVPAEVIDICKNSTFLHSRRTDYTTSNGYHPVMGNEYFKQALEYACDTGSVCLFTDDVSESSDLVASLKSDGYSIHVISELGLTDLQEMYLMSVCSGAVISNSSFSWWSAFLGPHLRGQKVVAPAKWFGPTGPQDTDDIYINGWKRI